MFYLSFIRKEIFFVLKQHDFFPKFEILAAV